MKNYHPSIEDSSDLELLLVSVCWRCNIKFDLCRNKQMEPRENNKLKIDNFDSLQTLHVYMYDIPCNSL